MRALITGATGTIGRELRAALGPDTTILSRDPARARERDRTLDKAHVAPWNGEATPASALFEGLDAVFHLAGEPVAEGRWTADKKRRILESRTHGTRAVVAAIGGAARKPRVLVCASAVGFYGSRGDEVLTEASAPGAGFLPDVCAAWEHEAREAERLHGVRTVMLRIGIVLARRGGALDKMRPLFRAGLGGRLGDGRAWMPWIHVDDVVGLFLHAAADERLAGPVNAVAPQAATNATFTRALASAVARPAVLAVPSFALELALGELASVVLASQRVVPERAAATGYRFRYPELDGALAEAAGVRPQSALAGTGA